jgi:PAS domain S-box-containing protein
MVAAQGIFGISRLGFLNLFKSSPAKGMALVRANLGAFALEGAAFVGTERGISHLIGRKESEDQNWAQSLGHAYLTLGLLKGLGGLTHAALKKGYANVPVGNLTWQDRLMVRSTPQAASFLGIFLSHSLAPSLGLGEPMDLADRLSQSATALVHFGIAGQILGRLPRYAELNERVKIQTDQLIQDTWGQGSHKLMEFSTCHPQAHPNGIGRFYSKNDFGEEDTLLPGPPGKPRPLSPLPPQSQALPTVADMAIPGFILRIKTDGTVLDVQGNPPENFPISKTDFAGQRVQDLPFTPPVRDKLLAALKQAIYTQQIQTVEFTLPAPEGLLHQEVIVAPTALDETIVIALDITKYKIKEAERGALLSILNASSEMVSGVSLEGKIYYANQEVLDRLGPMTEEQRIQREDFYNNYPERAAEMIQKVAIPTAIREGVWVGETAVLDGVGREIPVLQRIIAHRDSEGKLTHFSAILTDITDMKRVRDFRLSEERLKAVKLVVPGLIHDINNHLLGITLRNEIFKSKLRSLADMAGSVRQVVQNHKDFQWNAFFEELRDRLRTIFPNLGKEVPEIQGEQTQDPAVRVLADLENILGSLQEETRSSQLATDQITYLLKGLRELDAAPKQGPAFNISNIVNPDVLREVLPAEPRIQLTVRADSIFVPGPQNEILRAIHNIVKNAAEAMAGQANPVIDIQSQGIVLDRITLSKMFPLWKDWGVGAGKFVKIEIQDNGQGMDEPTRLRIFEPFFSTKKRDQTGSAGDIKTIGGVGLATTRKIIKDAGGFILVESEPGQGARFDIYLPEAIP